MSLRRMIIVVGLCVTLMACRDRYADWQLDPLFLEDIAPPTGTAVYSGGYVFADIAADNSAEEPPHCARDLERFPQILSGDGSLYLVDFFAQLDGLAWVPAVIVDGQLRARWQSDGLRIVCVGTMRGAILPLECQMGAAENLNKCRIILQKIF